MKNMSGELPVETMSAEDSKISYLDYAENSLRDMGAYWTAREITQQPAAWLKVSEIIHNQAKTITQFLEPLLAQENLRIILTGAGTSAFVGASIAPVVLQVLEKRIESIATTDLVSAPQQYLQKSIPTLMVSFARSGNSPESVAAIDLTNKYVDQCFHLVITCNQKGELYLRCNSDARSLALLMPEETNDQSFAMTSSFTCMLLAAVSVFPGVIDLNKTTTKIAAAASTLIKDNNAFIQAIANRNFNRVIYLGSNGFKGLAQESSLKLLELTGGKIVASFDSPLGFRHGPKSIVNNETLVVVFLSNNPHTRKYDLDLLRELRRDNEAGLVLAITAQVDAEALEDYYLFVQGMDEASDIELLFPYVVIAQMYAFHHALCLGNRPDSPSVSGSVNRVVKGVIIHQD